MDNNRPIAGDMAKMREALNAAKRFIDQIGASALAGEVDTMVICQCAASLSARIERALAAPARNCDLIANELSIAPERVPEALNKCENAPIRELIRWIFAKAEGRRGTSKPTLKESAVADVARSVAADMRRMERKCWKGRRMGEYAVALMLDGFASRLEGAYNRPPKKEEGAE